MKGVVVNGVRQHYDRLLATRGA